MAAYVPPAYKVRINEIIREGIRKAEQHYHIKLEFPSIIYKKRGRCAGTGSYTKWEIDLNPVLLWKEGDTFINETPIHELAHLITDRVYPEAHDRGIKIVRGRIRREKREVHGPSWYEVMNVLGVANPQRCHTFDTSHLPKKHVTKYPYTCSCKTWDLGPKRHKKLVMAAAIGARCPYRCPHCKGDLKLGMNAPLTPIAKPKPVVQFVTLGTSSMFKSKYDLARHIMKFGKTKTRGELIAEMVNEAGCTPAGAATYYAKLKNELGI